MGGEQGPVADEPAFPATAGDPGSSHMVPTETATGDALRSIACAVLVAGCVGAPESAPLLAPFVPALVAIRWLRTRRGRERFLALASTLSLMASIASAPTLVGDAPLRYSFAVLMAALLVPVLGVVHARAARPDPVVADAEPWPEPRLRSGLSPAIGAWTLAVLLLVACTLPSVADVRRYERAQVRDAYEFYGCGPAGSRGAQTALCTGALEQRDQLLRFVSDHSLDVLGGLVVLIALGSAATAHLVVLARTRHRGARVRPRWRLREFEVHWSAPYLVALGIGAWLLVDGASDGVEVIRATGVATGLLGVLLLMAQGAGLVAWLLSRRHTPGWYRVFLVVAALLAGPVTPGLAFAMGVLDQALHPRRRALASGNVPGRGSGS